MKFPIRVPALRVRQPLGDFYAVSLPAHTLLDLTYSVALRVEEGDAKSGYYDLEGAQRQFNLKRAREIADFINGTEAAFPNSIILGANFTEDGDYLGDDSTGRAWNIKKESGGTFSLIIPTDEKLAAIVDGQHRLGGFREASEAARGMDLLCAVYLDLPVPFQAYLFATINFNQKKVDKSLAYELFGFGMDGKNSDSWPPEQLSVFLCRRLNVEPDSPFHHKIKVVAENRESLEDEDGTLVSTATIVEGILSLISKKPSKDRALMSEISVLNGRSRSQLEADGTPLRAFYLMGQDAVIYQLVKNYFQAVAKILWKDVDPKSYIKRTVGVQALFDVLKEISAATVASKDLSVETMLKKLRPLQKIDYADNFFQASGKGRVRLKNCMLLRLALVEINKLPDSDLDDYVRLENR